jgi:predicted dithiol-disulfide oxidoreductase (DUF899 family)
VQKDYRFTARGRGDATLLDLFDGSRQLVVYRFFMDPDMDVYPERGCPGCSMYTDQLSNPLHLRQCDVAQWHGTKVFCDTHAGTGGDEVYRTYFIDARCDEALGST